MAGANAEKVYVVGGSLGPSGVQSENLAQVAGTTTAVGSGTMNSGTQRVALATDSPGVFATGTAGTPSTAVLTVQGIASMTPMRVTPGGEAYETVAASQTAQVLGGSGAIGDYLSQIVVFPGTTSPGNVIILDNNTTVGTFAGGANSVSNLVPFVISVGALSVSGAWKITTGSNVTVLAVGRFT